MLLKYRSAVCILGKYMQNNVPVMFGPINYPSDTAHQVRNIKKHWNPKFRKERREKFIKIKLPNFEETTSDKLSNDEIRSRMKEVGAFPQKTWSERPAYISCTPSIFESYVAPEGDGRFSTITKKGAMQRFEFVEKKGKSYLAVKKIRGYDPDFQKLGFLENALEIYKKAHEALAAKDKDNLIQYVTETAYPTMIHNLMDKTIHWKFLESLEPARVVHARCTNIITKENIYAQLTVRFHTQQVLCVYDRFGRVMQGSEILRKDVLEYVVYEKHLANEYGVWRIHGKIIPSWMPPGEVGERTYFKPVEPEEPSSSDTASEIVSKTVDIENEKGKPANLG